MAVRTQDQVSNSQRRVEEQRPLGGYAALTSLFGALSLGFAEWLRRSGRELPEQLAPGDLALMTVATHKLSRLIAKDRVTSVVRSPFTAYERESGPGEVEEAARGSGMMRAVGELVICPYCLDMWVAAAFTAGFAAAPRGTRWVTSMLSALSGADVLQIAYKKFEQSL
jgi:hypothetical protein